MLALLSIILFSEFTYSENAMGICNGVKFSNIFSNSNAFEAGLVFKKDNKLLARLFLDVQIEYNKLSGSYANTNILILPDISISYAILTRKCSNVYLGIGFSTEFQNIATCYIPIGVEYFISNYISFYTNMRVGAYYKYSFGETNIIGGIFGGDIGIIYYL
jgi:hypothetical protein